MGWLVKAIMGVMGMAEVIRHVDVRCRTLAASFLDFFVICFHRLKYSHPTFIALLLEDAGRPIDEGDYNIIDIGKGRIEVVIPHPITFLAIV